jgi:hypothetical protein
MPRQEFFMSHRLACAGFSLLVLVAPRIATANTSVPLQITYDAVDFVDIKNEDICDGCSRSEAIVLVRGVPTGQSTPATATFNFGINKDMATRCERLATIAMSRPGKYQFAIGADNHNSPDGGHGHCQLTLVSP